jgi:hypothetical protein
VKLPALSQNLLPCQIPPDCACTVELDISATPHVANIIAVAPANAITVFGNLNNVFFIFLFVLVVYQKKKNILKKQTFL